MCEEQKASWPQVLDHTLACINGQSKQVLKGLSPVEIVYGKKFLLDIPNVDQDRHTDPESFAVNAKANLHQIHKYINLCNKIADEKHLAKFNEKPTRPALKIGDIVKVNNPIANKYSSDQWQGQYQVISANDYCSKLINLDSSKTDWYSNHRLKVIPPRPLHLEPESDSESEVECQKVVPRRTVPTNADSRRGTSEPVKESTSIQREPDISTQYQSLVPDLSTVPYKIVPIKFNLNQKRTIPKPRNDKSVLHHHQGNRPQGTEKGRV